MADSDKVAAIRALLDSFITRGDKWITVEDHAYYDNRFLDDLFAILDDGPRVVDNRKLTESVHDGNFEAIRREMNEPPITEQVRRGFIPFDGDDRG